MHNFVFNYLYIPVKPLEICGHIFFSEGEDMCVIDLRILLYCPVIA